MPSPEENEIRALLSGGPSESDIRKLIGDIDPSDIVSIDLDSGEVTLKDDEPPDDEQLALF